METLRYIGAALAAGLIAVFASENLFWSVPRADFAWPGWLLAWALYAAGAGVALSAVAFTGCGGWRGLFLGGAVRAWWSRAWRWTRCTTPSPCNWSGPRLPGTRC